MISAEELRTEELRLKYLKLIQRPDVFPTRANWEFIISNAMRGLGYALYHKYLTAVTIDENDRQNLHDVAAEEFPRYLAAIDRLEAIDVVYSDITTAPTYTVGLIRKINLFDANSLIYHLDNGDYDFVFSVLDVYQPTYDESDLEPMDELMSRIDNLPALGKIENRPGLFGSSEKYICPDGHVNPSDAEYCRHTGCGKDARGLTEAQENAVTIYFNRLEALHSLLSLRKE